MLGALVILAAGALVDRWCGTLLEGWLEGHTGEPPVRQLIVRAVRISVLFLAVVVALDKFGFQIAPLVAGVGVAGLGIGFVVHRPV